jgi:hypothetical protein
MSKQGKVMTRLSVWLLTIVLLMLCLGLSEQGYAEEGNFHSGADSKGGESWAMYFEGRGGTAEDARNIIRQWFHGEPAVGWCYALKAVSMPKGEREGEFFHGVSLDFIKQPCWETLQLGNMNYQIGRSYVCNLGGCLSK